MDRPLAATSQAASRTSLSSNLRSSVSDRRSENLSGFLPIREAGEAHLEPNPHLMALGPMIGRTGGGGSSSHHRSSLTSTARTSTSTSPPNGAPTLVRTISLVPQRLRRVGSSEGAQSLAADAGDAEDSEEGGRVLLPPLTTVMAARDSGRYPLYTREPALLITASGSRAGVPRAESSALMVRPDLLFKLLEQPPDLVSFGAGSS